MFKSNFEEKFNKTEVSALKRSLGRELRTRLYTTSTPKSSSQVLFRNSRGLIPVIIVKAETVRRETSSVTYMRFRPASAAN